MRPNCVQRFLHWLKAPLSALLILYSFHPFNVFAQGADNFFDDELPEEKKNSGDLKSKPVELKGEDEEEKKKALQKTNEKGEVILPKEKTKTEGPTDQVAPLAARPKETILDNSRFSLAGDYFLNVGRGTATLPSGWGAFLAYDADESRGRGFDLRFEAGFLNIAKGSSSIMGGYFEAGPTWIFRVSKMPMQFMTAILPGLGFYEYKNDLGKASALKFTAHIALGVEFPMSMKRSDRTDEFVPFIQVRSGIIYDTQLPMMHYGVYGGVAYKFGQVIFKY